MKYAAIAAFLLIAIASAWLLWPRETNNRVRFELLEVRADHPERVLENNAKVPVGTTIAFRLTLTERACVTLYQENVALFDEPKCLEVGTQLYQQHGEPARLVLEEPGLFTFYVEPGEQKQTLDVLQ